MAATQTALTGVASRDGRAAVGYVRQWSADPPSHLDTLNAHIDTFARRRGLVLVDVLTEHDYVSASNERAAFAALLDTLRRPCVCAVIIPGPEHFSQRSGLYQAMCTAIAVETGATVMVLPRPGGGAP